MAQDLGQWLRTNPAAPGFPTSCDQRRWRRRCLRRLSQRHARSMFVVGRRLTSVTFEATPWGGVERLLLGSPWGPGLVADAVRITVLRPLAPGERRHPRLDRLTRRRTTAEIGVALRGGTSPDPWADLPGRRTTVRDPRDAVRREDARRITVDRAQRRAVAGTVLAGAAGIAVSGGLSSLVCLVAALVGMLAVLAPVVLAGLGRARSRSFAVAQDDPRYVMGQVLSYYCAQRRAIGPRADELVAQSWQALYAAADADVLLPAVRSELDAYATGLICQSAYVTASIAAREDLERLAALPYLTAVERREDEVALAHLAGLPSPSAVRELTQEVRTDVAAEAAARRRLEPA